MRCRAAGITEDRPAGRGGLGGDYGVVRHERPDRGAHRLRIDRPGGPLRHRALVRRTRRRRIERQRQCFEHAFRIIGRPGEMVGRHAFRNQQARQTFIGEVGDRWLGARQHHVAGGSQCLQSHWLVAWQRSERTPSGAPCHTCGEDFHHQAATDLGDNPVRGGKPALGQPISVDQQNRSFISSNSGSDPLHLRVGGASARDLGWQ